MISKSKIKLLQSLKLKKFRQKYDLFVAEGDKVFHSLLHQDNYSLKEIYATNEWVDTNLVNEGEFDLHYATPSELNKISGLKNPSQVVCVIRMPKGHQSLVGINKAIYLENVQDPGNVGSIVRTADWFGIEAVIRSSGSADFYNPKVIQSTMGSFANLRLMTSDFNDFKRDAQNLPVLAMSLKGQPLNQILPMSRFCLVVGHEGQGISESIAGRADALVRIAGSESHLADSLNASVATGILCHHLTLTHQ